MGEVPMELKCQPIPSTVRINQTQKTLPHQQGCTNTCLYLTLCLVCQFYALPIRQQIKI